MLDSPAGISVATITGTSISGNATFADLVPDANTGIGINATFTVNRIAGAYSVTCSAGGNGYVAGDVLTIYGTQLAGTTPANDLTITITGTIGALDSVHTFDISGTSVTSNATFTAITCLLYTSPSPRD